MKHHIFILMLLATMSMAGCRDDSTLYDLSAFYEASSQCISFDNADDSETTRGTVFNDTNLVEIEVYAYYTAQNSWSDTETVVDPFMLGQQVNKANSVWSYTPLKYWPNNTSDKLTFFGFAPADEITCTHDATTQRPTFTYSMSQNASDNDDLLVTAPHYDCTHESHGSGIIFDFEHALTRISLKAALNDNNTVADYAAMGEYNVRYVINGITFYGLHSTAEMTFDENNGGSWSWVVNDDATDPTVEYTATQGLTLLPYDDSDNYLTATPEEVCIDGLSIFVLPQSVADATLQVRVRKVYDTYDINNNYITESIVYATSNTIPIPTSDDSGVWEASMWHTLIFTFNVEDLAAYDTPMTISSAVYEWSEATVDVEIHNNIYIYSSLSDIEATTDEDGNTYGEFMICTNYDYNLRVPHHREELDGEITSSRGFLFFSDDFPDDTYPNTNHVGYYTTGGKTYKIFVPTLLNLDKKEIVYVSKDNLADYGYTETSTTVNGLSMTFGSNGFGYEYNDITYDLLYYDPDNNNAITPFTYNTTGEHEIDLSKFEQESTVYFKIIIGDIGESEEYEFDFSVKKSTRKLEGLYTSTAINGDNSYGVNKYDDDPVYILRLSVDSTHLLEAGGEFNDIIGVEMISNGGGMITQRFFVTLK